MRLVIAILTTFVTILGIIFYMRGGEGLYMYFSPALIITVIFPLLYVTILRGINGLRNAFTIQRNKNPTMEVLIDAHSFFRMYGKVTWLSSISATMVGAIGYVVNAKAVMEFGPDLSLALMSVFYAALINIIIVLPFTIHIRGEMEKKSNR